jgi:hypothetical protein
MKRLIIVFSVLVLSGCLTIGSIHGTSEVLQRPDAPASNISVVYIQTSLTEKRGVPIDPIPLLAKDGYYRIANEMKLVVPQVARERGIQATITVGGANSIHTLSFESGRYDTAQGATRKELVLFVKGGHLDPRGNESDFIFHAIFRDPPTGVEYWHSDYRIHDARLPNQIPLDEAKVHTLISQIFDDLQKEGLLVPSGNEPR